MTEEQTDLAAQLLADAWRSRTTIDFPTSLLPQNRPDAYVIQTKMSHLVYERIAGWKVDATSPGIQKAEGYDGPIPGRIYGSTLYASPCFYPALACPYAKIEAEIAFCFTHDVAPEDAPFTLTDLADLVVVQPAFEITSTRYTPDIRLSWNLREGMLADIADNGSGGIVVVGREVWDWQHIDFMDLTVDLRINDGPSIPNLVFKSRGNPLDALVWVVNHACANGYKFWMNSYVLTGSLIEPQPFRLGDRAAAEFPGIGDISVSLIQDRL